MLYADIHRCTWQNGFKPLTENHFVGLLSTGSLPHLSTNTDSSLCIQHAAFSFRSYLLEACSSVARYLFRNILAAGIRLESCLFIWGEFSSLCKLERQVALKILSRRYTIKMLQPVIRSMKYTPWSGVHTRLKWLKHFLWMAKCKLMFLRKFSVSWRRNQWKFRPWLPCL